ncbi:hypothetical protein, partial [Aquabacterium soli]|uniref:hypothetical protein n=1 Tax=Aquabacterium soli TaxID=2493092 RepID=UPI001F2C08A1
AVGPVCSFGVEAAGVAATKERTMSHAQNTNPLTRPVHPGKAGDTRTVVMNRCKITMRHDGKQWWNIKVEPA